MNCKECGAPVTRHSKLGFCHTCANRLIPRARRSAEEHQNWKGDEAGRKARLERGRKIARRLYDPTGSLCCRCLDAPAVERHHIDGDTTNNAPENVEMLCHSCHSVLTNREVQPWLSKRVREAAAPSAKPPRKPTRRATTPTPKPRPRKAAKGTATTTAGEES